MSNNNQISTPTAFRQQATTIAYSLLKDWVGEDRAKEATGRIAVAVAASAAAARDPKDFYACTPSSVATCIATAALTGIMPSTGSASLAYLVPQPPRSGEPPQLQYMLSHRGLNALARRCGQQMIAVPVSHSDDIQSDAFGMMQVVSRDIDNPPTTEQELRGVMVLVRELSSGQVIAQGWVPKKIIESRKSMSKSAKSQYSPWAKWYVEMAMKTAMHYAISRGWCVIDDTEAVRAIRSDADADLGQDTYQDVIDVTPRKGVAALRDKIVEGPSYEELQAECDQATSRASLLEAKAKVTDSAITDPYRTELLETLDDRLAMLDAQG